MRLRRFLSRFTVINRLCSYPPFRQNGNSFLSFFLCLIFLTLVWFYLFIFSTDMGIVSRGEWLSVAPNIKVKNNSAAV